MITHHPVRYQFDLLHTCIYKPGKDRGNAFIHRNGDAGILSLRVRDCASLQNQRGREKRRQEFSEGGFYACFEKKKKREKTTAYFLHANDDKLFHALCVFKWRNGVIIFPTVCP